MEFHYTSEKNVQMLIYLMKQHGVKKVIVSPGTTNVTFVASIQNDPFFELYSAADERSAAYMACGLAAETGEAVALSCTGATASRNYIPGLTEAYYRKLPVLAITSTQHTGRIGQLCAQVIDRSVIQNDIALKSVQIPLINTEEDEWDCNLKLNGALLALRHRGGGPVHVNLMTQYSRNFDVAELPEYRVIRRVGIRDEFPEIADNKRIAVFVGAHLPWSNDLTKDVDEFCEKYNVVVLQDHTGNYHGKYGVEYSLVAAQKHKYETREMDLLIDIGEMSGAYMNLRPKEVWRISADGEIRDRWRKITKIFDMEEQDFFIHYNKIRADAQKTSYYDECISELDQLMKKIPELPFSNDWIASVTADKIPGGSALHLGILNTLRSWNFFHVNNDVDCFCNTGGFGIDGVMSSCVGASFANPDRLHILVIGDLAFFYDLNSIANHKEEKNLRILLINNGCGTEFKNYNHFASQFGDVANEYMAAMGHYGNKSPELVRHYATDLGFEYLAASTKEEYLSQVERFLIPEITDKPMLFEVFTEYHEESDALKGLNTIESDPPTAKDKAKHLVKELIGEDKAHKLKRIIKG